MSRHRAVHRLLVVSTFLLSSGAVAGRTPQMRQGDVDVGDGVRIHYVDGGARDAKRTLLFVPGWCTSADIWRDAMQELSPAARVVSIDPRPQGRSTVTPRGNTPEQRAQDLRRVIRALGLSEIVLVGWSQGVQDVAAYAAALHGEGIAGYVLVDAALGAGAAAAVAQPTALQQQLERLIVYQQHPKEYLEGMMNAIIQSPAGRARIAEYVETGLRTPPDLGISMLLVDFIAYDRRPALASFDRPTLIIASAISDELEAQRAMAKQIPGADIAVIENAGHAVFLDQPRRFQELLTGFIERLAPRR